MAADLTPREAAAETSSVVEAWLLDYEQLHFRVLCLAAGWVKRTGANPHRMAVKTLGRGRRSAGLDPIYTNLAAFPGEAQPRSGASPR